MEPEAEAAALGAEEASPFAWFPPAHFLQPYPRLTQLLRGLAELLGPSGGSFQLEKELQQAQARLATSRWAWLRSESQWRGLKELLAMIDRPRLRPQVLRQLELSLAAPKRPPGASSCPPGASSCPPEASSCPPEVNNSPPGLDGPKPPPLLQALEHVLGQKVLELGQFLGRGSQALAPGGVAQALASDRLRLGHAQQRQRQLSHALQHHQHLYLQALRCCLSLLPALSAMAAAWAELDRSHARFLQAKGVALLLKIRLEELQLLLDTYPAPTLQAHRQIRLSLQASLRQAQGRAASLRSELSALTSLGPTFTSLATDYRHLKATSQQKQWQLQQLRAGGGQAPPPAL